MNNELILTDAQGTPAGYGDTVQYILDKLGNEALGPELVTNGGFDNGADNWSLSTGLNVVNGELQFDGGQSYIAIQPISALKNGNLYVVSVDVTFTETPQTSGGLILALGATSSLTERVSVIEADDVSGTYKFILRSYETNLKIAANRMLSGAQWFTGTVDNVSIRELKGTHALQTNSALKPVRGRVPVGGRRNFRSTSEAFDAGWVQDGLIVTPNATIPPKGMARADKIEAAVGGGGRLWAGTTDTTLNQKIVQSFFVKAVENSDDLFRFSRSGGWSGVGSAFVRSFRFNPSDGSFLDVDGPIETLNAKPFEDGWFRIDVPGEHYSSGSGAYYSLNVSNGADNERSGGVYVTGASFEIGVTPGPYQRVTSNLDIYEPGAQHTEYLRFDHVDDKMAQTFPDGFSGDLVVCGTEGSWIDKDVTVAAGNDLTIGPKNLPNTSGILPALGDIIGWVPVGKSLTSAEQRAIVDYYRGRGAKGRLVPSGVELVTNGTFDSDVSSWAVSGDAATTLTYESGRMLVDAATGFDGAEQDVTVEPGKTYIAKVEIEAGTANLFRILLGTIFSNLTGSGEVSVVWRADKTSAKVQVYTQNDAGTFYADNISVQELIPEEDLA